MPPNTLLPFSYDPLVVAASFAIAVLASYVTFDLARRVHHAQKGLGLAWWLAGSLVMGTGIWSMHFLGMQAFELPIALGYTGGMTLLSWAAAVAASAVALGIASRGMYRIPELAIGAVAIGGGISGMHYIGMGALDMEPGIVWDWRYVALSIAIAMVISAVALVIFQWLLKLHGSLRLIYQLIASLVMASAICGMHYTGMAAAGFPAGSICQSATALGGPGLTAMVIIASGMLLISTLVTSILDARLQSTARRLTVSLQQSNTTLKTANAELQKRAYADALTGLPNRLLFEDRLHHALLRLDRVNQHRVVDRLAVLFVDLDGFKPINDSFGHAAGDVVLANAAQRLRADARQSDTVARVGGDEFLVLMEDVDSVADCVMLANRIIESLSLPFEVAGRQVQIGCSVGIVLHPDYGERDKLVSNADAAMYAAKRAGGNGYALFERHMHSDASAQLELLNDLRQAIARNELRLLYQPKIDASRGLVNGVEALLRWTHARHGPISPMVFIALAERYGLISRLGSWVIEEACRQLAEWKRAGVYMRVAINLSVHQLREAGLAERIAMALERHGVDSAQLLCEITETVAMEDIRATQRTFQGLGAIGVFLSIDDFGTGYSSLNYLRQLPAKQLKIDSSFVSDLETKEDARAVVEAVVRLAHALSLSVVAEGVETSGQRDILVAMGCDELQGFFFAHPMPATTLLQWSHGLKPEGTADFAPSILSDLR